MKRIGSYFKTICVAATFLLQNSAGAAQGYFASSDGVNIYYTDSVEGDTAVVLLHGQALDHTMWFEPGIQQQLAKDLRVITLDFRGHGLSDKPLAVANYGPKVGLDVMDLLDHLKIDKAHMVGFSMGAFVLGRLVVTHPSRIASATLCSGGFPISSDEENAFIETSAQEMEDHGEDVFASVARGWALDFVTEAQVANVELPILSVFGSEELVHGSESMLRIVGLPKSSRPVLVIEGADHGSNKAAVLHADFLSAVRNFITENR